MWNTVLDAVLRRPLVSAIGATAILLVLASPALNMRAVLSGTDDLPRDLPVMQVYDEMEESFPGGQIPAVVTIKGEDVTSPAVVASIKDLEQRAIASGRFNAPVDVTVSEDKHVAQIAIPIKGSGTDEISNEGLADLRQTLVGQTVGGAEGVSAAYVSGMTAETKDYVDFLKGRAPLVVGFVLVLAFLLLLVTFRSLIIPIKAIILNLLSVAAAYGVLTWVFQDGHFEGALDFSSNGGVTAWLPIFLFVILFGLSMDYHVFILSRVKEAVDRGMKTEDAVSHAIKATASTVTSAAIVMVAVFAIFATLSFIDFKQMGVGLSVAILIDATLVRAVLLPATMKLLGKWNWYLPKRLHWLPEFSHGKQRPSPLGASSDGDPDGHERRPREVRGGRRSAVEGRVDGDGGDRHEADEQARAAAAELLDGAEPEHEREGGRDQAEVEDRGDVGGARRGDVAGAEDGELDGGEDRGPGRDSGRAEAREQRRGEQREADLADERGEGEQRAEQRDGAVGKPCKALLSPCRLSAPLTIAAPATTTNAAGRTWRWPVARASRTGLAPMITPALVAPMWSTAASTARLKPTMPTAAVALSSASSFSVRLARGGL